MNQNWTVNLKGFSCFFSIFLVISLLPELVNWVRDLRYAVCRGCARLRTHWHYQQLPHTDPVLLKVNSNIIQFSRPNTSVALNRTCVLQIRHSHPIQWPCRTGKPPRERCISPPAGRRWNEHPLQFVERWLEVRNVWQTSNKLNQ